MTPDVSKSYFNITITSQNLNKPSLVKIGLSFKIFLTYLPVLLNNFVIFTFVSQGDSKFKELQYQKEFFFSLTISYQKETSKASLN